MLLGLGTLFLEDYDKALGVLQKEKKGDHDSTGHTV
jgi:hypothetical protein